ncbi:SCO family protein [Ideonella livida]|uniref:SCO family protein n=1 Tax=Ideonella livida TaxID=2707176 RepID=A0A7C9TNL1_9BURK|nr:SCO family protein [Ideonella livida]NDY92566.1 SCO family protein [Ideonella livida]
MPTRRASLAAFTALSLSAASGLLAGCQPTGGSSAGGRFKGIDLAGLDYARRLDLTDPEGRRRSLAEFKGKVLVVFFGYTQCPDVCPTTLAELAAVRQQLGPDGARVQGIFVTVDPERDTSEVLRHYVGSFGSDFVALRGTLEETQAVAKEFKVFFAKAQGKTEGAYTVDHTAGSYLFDAQGRVRVFSRYGAGAEALVHDLKLLLQEG